MLYTTMRAEEKGQEKDKQPRNQLAAAPRLPLLLTGKVLRAQEREREREHYEQEIIERRRRKKKEMRRGRNKTKEKERGTSNKKTKQRRRRRENFFWARHGVLVLGKEHVMSVTPFPYSTLKQANNPFRPLLRSAVSSEWCRTVDGVHPRFLPLMALRLKGLNLIFLLLLLLLFLQEKTIIIPILDVKGNARLVFDSFSRCSVVVVVYGRVASFRPVSNESDGLRSVDPNTTSSPGPAQEQQQPRLKGMR